MGIPVEQTFIHKWRRTRSRRLHRVGPPGGPIYVIFASPPPPPPPYARTFGTTPAHIESLEDRWHLVFARRDQVSTRSKLETSGRKATLASSLQQHQLPSRVDLLLPEIQLQRLPGREGMGCGGTLG